MPSARSRSTKIAVILAAISMGCSDAGPRSLSVAGTWSGFSAFGGTQPPSTIMTLTQNGDAISGTMRVTGSFLSRPITGTVDRDDRTLTWLVLDGCEAWGGVLNIDADGTGMSGAVGVDRSGCTGQNSSGTMTLTKQ